MPPSFFSGALRGRITVWPGTSSNVLMASPSVPPITCFASSVEQVLQFLHQPRHAAGIMEMLHVMIAGRLQIDQHRRPLADLVDTLRATAACCVRPAMAERCTTPLVEPPIACSMTMRVAERVLGQDLATASARRPWPSRRRACRSLPRCGCGRHAAAGIVAAPGSVMPIASIMQAMVLARAHHLQVPTDGTSRSFADFDILGARCGRREIRPTAGGNRCRRRAPRP